MASQDCEAAATVLRVVMASQDCEAAASSRAAAASSQDCEAAASSRAEKEEQKKVRVAASSRAKKKEQKTVRVAASSSRAEKEEQKEERRTVRVTSNDGEEFEMDEAVARGSVMLRHMMELGIALDGITLPIVSGEILALAVSYLRASNYMEIEGLLRLTCQTVAEKLKGKTTEEIRQTFCIQNDYPPEEEEEVREEISWALEEKSLD
ncbi:SKP1-like protein 11 [Ananas comosus]|uniref:SKP1-like protein 11 n=1 Tax=Ananas comosus TaxID=4615 RepID=A0A6P5GXN4_ANACO|nr:SKP1-like protein 11 [Ananas comosus]